MKRKLIIVLMAILVICSPLAAASAKVTYVRGKTEVNRNNNWVPLSVGDTVQENEMISTGFKSEIRLNIDGSIVAVAALSRVTLETLSINDTHNSVNLYVNTGAARSKISHTNGKKIDYSARTSVAVASVRGTDFIITSFGKIKCFEGAVAVYPAKLYNPNRKVSNKRENAPANEDAATALTPSDEISENAPSSAIVVGAGQETKVSKKGKTASPYNMANKNHKKKKNYVKTAKERDAINSGSDISNSFAPANKTGSIQLEITLEEETPTVEQ